MEGLVSRMIGGRYRLDRELAAGGFGAVWQAFDSVLRVDVAIKEVRIDPHATAAERAKAVARAEHEARNAARLRDHPHIVTIHDVVTDQEVPWLVMRLVAGRSLHQELAARGGRLPAAEAGRITEAVLSALAVAHQAGIVHRDVKPANIMLAEDGTVLLTDFGIAKHHADTAQTTHGMLIGSLPYMSPERLNGEDLPAGDLFALGATLYEMTEGISPFLRDTPTATMSAVALREPDPPRNAGRLADLVMALLAKDPAERPDAPAALARIRDTAQSPAPTLAVTVAATAPATVAGAAPTAAPATASTPPSTSTSTRPSPSTGGRHGRVLVNELVRTAESGTEQAGPATSVLQKVVMRVAGHDLRFAERLLRAVEDSGGSRDVRISLAEKVFPADPQAARRLLSTLVRPDSGHPIDVINTALRIWTLDLKAAERLILAIDEPEGGQTLLSFGLIRLAVAVAPVDAANAERIARSVPTSDHLPQALAGVAARIAADDPERAGTLIAEAVRVTRKTPFRWRALSEVAIEVARFDPRQAEQLVRTMIASAGKPGPFRRGSLAGMRPYAQRHALAAMAAVAAEMVQIDPRHAGELADETEAGNTYAATGSEKSSLLSHLAVAWSAVDPQRAAEAVEEAVRINLSDERDNSGLEAVAGVIAGALPELAEHIACDLIDSAFHRDRMIRELGDRHPRLVARIRAAHPTVADIMAAAVTDPREAAELARAADGEEQIHALIQLAETIFDREPALAGQLCDEAEDLLQDPDVPGAVAALFATAARSAADPDRAHRLPAELVRIVESAAEQDPSGMASAMAAMLMTGFDPQRAESLARTVADDEWRTLALGHLACHLIGLIDDTRESAPSRPASTVFAWLGEDS